MARRLVERVAISWLRHSTAANLVRRGDMISTLPQSIALREAKREPLAFLELPYEPLRVTIETVWHQRVEQEAGLQWFLSKVLQAVADLNDQEAQPPHSASPTDAPSRCCRNSSRQPLPDYWLR
jgi:DNA-binding transcriptional LysR family regulator